MCYLYNAPTDIAAVPCPMCMVFKPSAARYSPSPRPRPRPAHPPTAVRTSATSATTEPTTPASTSSTSKTPKVRPSLRPVYTVPTPPTVKSFNGCGYCKVSLLSSDPPRPHPFRHSGLAQIRNSPCSTTMAGLAAAGPPPRASTGSYSPQTGPPSASYTAYPCPQR